VRRAALLVLVALPAAGAGTLAAHVLAYGLLGASGEGAHGYLAHLPQVLTILSLPALLAAAIAGRSASPRAWPFAVAALSAFAVQEHLERLAHTGQLPLLLDRPVFWLGLALQVPFALAAWLVARWFLRAAGGVAARRVRRVPSLLLPLPEPVGGEPSLPSLRGAVAARAPPALLQAR
jgi:hypothetical protein